MRITIYTICLFLLSVNVSGQTTIRIDAPESVAVGERFRIAYVIESGEGEFVAPEFDASFSVSGPQSSTQRSVQWINGDFSSVSTTTVIYYVVASAKGRFIIPPAKLVSKKVTISSEQIEIEVADSGSGSSQNRSQGQRTTQTGSDIYLRLILSHEEVYVGQPITVTLKLFTKINLAGLNDLKYPDFKGFLREDIQTEPPKELKMEVIDGVQYGTAVIQKFLLFPQVAGEIGIDPVQLTAMIQQRTTASDPFFDDPFFNSIMTNVTTVPRVIATGARTVMVKALPAPQPADFYGAVGNFTIKSELNKTTIEVNDALNFSVTLAGTGNLSLAGPPAISFPQGIEKYDPKINIKSSAAGAGSKTFEYLLIPRHNGTFEIPPLSYTVFDIDKGKYVTLRAPGFNLNVTGSSSTPETNIPSVPVQGDEVKYLGQDIRFIRTDDLKLKQGKLPLVSKTTYWLWFILALFVAATVLLLRREHIRRNADVEGLRNRKAASVAKKRLAKARMLLGTNSPALVNEELAKALWGFLGDKFSISFSDLSRENCYASMRNRNVEEDLISEVDQLLASCEYSRFSPSGKGESPEELFKKTGEIIRKLESVL